MSEYELNKEKLKEKATNCDCEAKFEKLLHFLTNMNANMISGSYNHHHHHQSELSSATVVGLKETISKKQFTIPEVIQSSTNIKTENELNGKGDKNITVLNLKSRTQNYPKSNITRFNVPDDKVSWSVKWPEYRPVEYTSKKVLFNSNADNNLMI